jgi:hypothetical protein
MRRKLLRLRPYVIAAFVGTILVVDLSNQWEVPIARIPGEFFERYVDTLDPYSKPADLLKLAETGNVQAQYVYALRHTIYAPVELQIEADQKLAFHWTSKAAENGHSRAMAVLAFYYYKGSGIVKDLAKARDWANKAVKKSQPMGFRVLGDVTKEEALAMRAKDGAPTDKKKQAAYEKAIKGPSPTTSEARTPATESHCDYSLKAMTKAYRACRVTTSSARNSSDARR